MYYTTEGKSLKPHLTLNDEILYNKSSKACDVVAGRAAIIERGLTLRAILIKLREAIFSVLPITGAVLLLHLVLVPLPGSVLAFFVSGALLLVVGMALFNIGADTAMMPMGEFIGSRLIKVKRMPILLAIVFSLGTIVTVAEPDLHILADQIPSVPDLVVILSVAIGVGLFLAIALLRIVLRVPLSYLLIGLYGIVFLVATFTEPDYLAVSFDSGGVTTGPITVPFILALGAGLGAVLGGQKSHEDSFGLVALCSVGPILSIMMIGLFYDPNSTRFAPEIEHVLEPDLAVDHLLQVGFTTIWQVALALLPILFFFLLFQLTLLKLSKQQITKLIIGMLYTYVGLVLFLTGVKVGFLPAGSFLGEAIGGSEVQVILIPLGAVIGFFVVFAEPAVHVLNRQVEDVTGGAISKRAMLFSLSIGVGLALSLSMARIIFQFSFWYILLPGYLLALGLSLLTPRVFTAIAFDSGGVASGPMTATFLLPLAIGATKATGGSLLADAFGVVSVIAMTPLITIQIMGLLYQYRLRKTEKEEQSAYGTFKPEDDILMEWSDRQEDL